MATVQDVFGTGPQTVLNKPFMHVQDVKAQNTNGGTSIVGWNERTLNTEVVNEIVGASLASNEVTLPAGTYYIQADSVGYDASAGLTVLAIRKVSDSSILLRSTNARHTAASQIPMMLSGKITLNESTAIKVSQYHTVAEANNGLGVLSNITGVSEVYCDLKIWQLDASVLYTVLQNDNLYPIPSGAVLTGNMHGLEYALTAVSTVQVQPGVCMDQTNQVMLTLETAQDVTIPTTLSTIQNLFLCDDGVVRTDTDVTGANLSAYDIRWIGFVRTDGTNGYCIDFSMHGDTFMFRKPNTQALIGTTTTTDLLLNINSLVPISRCRTKTYTVKGSAQAAARIGRSIPLATADNEDVVLYIHGSLYRAISPEYPADEDVYGVISAGTASFALLGVTLKR